MSIKAKMDANMEDDYKIKELKYKFDLNSASSCREKINIFLKHHIGQKTVPTNIEARIVSDTFLKMISTYSVGNRYLTYTSTFHNCSIDDLLNSDFVKH
jgi:hypothetical protein